MHAGPLRDELLAKADSMKVLPSLNTVVAEALRVMNDKDSSVNQLSGVVRYDQAFSSKIIGIANSAYYSRGWSITNIERAMLTIGFDEVRNILMCLVFLKEILGGWKLSQADLAALWTHSLSVTCAVKILACRTMTADPEEAFTASILHDLGKAIFYAYGEPYRKIIEEARATGRDICALERETFGVDHQEVGYRMAVRGRFPEKFSTVIRSHHGKSEAREPLPDLVRVADRFVENPDADLGADGMVLRREKDLITSETKRISELLGVVDARR
jgi:putative nucleotidyltransferase with HDIG domain